MPRGDGTGPMGLGPMTGTAAGFCAGYPAYGGGAYPYAPEVTPQQEAEFLKEQAKALQEELKSINERLGTLAKSAQEKK